MGVHLGYSARPAEKNRPCPAPPKYLGRSGAKLTADYIDTPFHNAHK